MVRQTFCSTNTNRVSGTETELFIYFGGQIKREKDIYHHGPKHIPIICHLPDPPSFSLPTTFNTSCIERRLAGLTEPWSMKSSSSSGSRRSSIRSRYYCLFIVQFIQLSCLFMEIQRPHSKIQPL
jgi:hypothetical protein